MKDLFVIPGGGDLAIADAMDAETGTITFREQN